MQHAKGPSPEAIFGTFVAYQRAAALKTAVDLGIFTVIDEGAKRAPEIAKRAGASERGTRILCDYLTVIDLLTKTGNEYALTPESAAFLSKKSPTYIGSVGDFVASPSERKNFDVLTATVKSGTGGKMNSVSPEIAEQWVTFARAMVPMMMPAALGIAEILGPTNQGPVKILDVAAGHGIFGLVLAQRNPQASVVALDLPSVVQVATENAAKMGVGDRHKALAGDAFGVEWGNGYDFVLLTNFLHQFDEPTATKLLEKASRALKPGGRVVVLEFVPNEDRVSPPVPAAFSLTMLANTSSGDAYTLAQLKKMLADAGFKGDVSAQALPTPETVVVAIK